MAVLLPTEPALTTRASPSHSSLFSEARLRVPSSVWPSQSHGDGWCAVPLPPRAPRPLEPLGFTRGSLWSWRVWRWWPCVLTAPQTTCSHISVTTAEPNREGKLGLLAQRGLASSGPGTRCSRLHAAGRCSRATAAPASTDCRALGAPGLGGQGSDPGITPPPRQDPTFSVGRRHKSLKREGQGHRSDAAASSVEINAGGGAESKRGLGQGWHGDSKGASGMELGPAHGAPATPTWPCAASRGDRLGPGVDPGNTSARSEATLPWAGRADEDHVPREGARRLRGGPSDAAPSPTRLQRHCPLLLVRVRLEGLV